MSLIYTGLMHVGWRIRRKRRKRREMEVEKEKG